MTRVTIRMPIGITYPEPGCEMPGEGATVGDALNGLIAGEARLRPRIFLDDSTLIVGVFVNGTSMRDLQGLDTPLAEGDVLSLVPPIFGG